MEIDGTRTAFRLQNGAGWDVDRVHRSRSEGEEIKGEDAIAVDEGPNGQGKGRWSNIWTIDLAEKKEKQITKEQWNVNGMSVSPDGKQVAVHVRRENERNNGNLSEIHTVDLATGAITKVTDNRAPESQVQWSPDGKSLSYIAACDQAWNLQRQIRVVDSPRSSSACCRRNSWEASTVISGRGMERRSTSPASMERCTTFSNSMSHPKTSVN